ASMAGNSSSSSATTARFRPCRSSWSRRKPIQAGWKPCAGLGSRPFATRVSRSTSFAACWKGWAESMSELQEAAKEFLIESHENLDQLDPDLVGLENAPAPAAALGRIFRTLHTIKGSCSFLAFPHLEAVAHAGENLLGKLRDGELALRPAVTEALLRMVDAIRRMLASIENVGNDGNVDEKDLIDLLTRLASEPPLTGTVVARHGPKDYVPGVSALDFELSKEVAEVA